MAIGLDRVANIIHAHSEPGLLNMMITLRSGVQ